MEVDILYACITLHTPLLPQIPFYCNSEVEHNDFEISSARSLSNLRRTSVQSLDIVLTPAWRANRYKDGLVIELIVFTM